MKSISFRVGVRPVAVTMRASLSAFALLVAVSASGHTQSTLASHRVYASRADLEEAAGVAERLGRSSPDKKERERKLLEASVIRERLRDGDFQPGHRIYLNVVSDTLISDTLTVRNDRKMVIRGLPEMSLVGVLDSELQSYLSAQISRYIKNATVHANGLVRLQISGSVGRPGFFSMPTDIPITDAIMLAGGPSPTADFHNVKVRRGDQVPLNANVMDEAIREGLTVSEIGLRPGDELNIGDASSAGWATTGNILKGAAALLLPLIYVFRRF